MLRRYVDLSKQANRVDLCWDSVIDRQVNECAGEDRWVVGTINQLEAMKHQLPARASFKADLRMQLQAASATTLTAVTDSWVDDAGMVTTAPLRQAGPAHPASHDTWLPPLDVSVDRIGRHMRLRRVIDFAAVVLVVMLVLVTVVSLVERGIGPDQQAVSPPGTIQVEPSALLPRDGESITAEAAAERVRSFLGEPADIDVTYLPDEMQYRVAFTSAERSGDEVSVDADTGEIVSAIFPSRTTSGRSADPLSADAALALATDFARSRFVDFATLEQLESRELTISRLAGGLNRGYRVVWRLRAGDPAVWLPTQVGVTVNLETAQVYAYDTLRHPYSGPTQPAISRDAAIQRVEVATEGDPRYGNLDVSEALLIAHADDTLQWLIGLRSSVTSMSFLAIVDAMTGEVAPITNGVAAPFGY